MRVHVAVLCSAVALSACGVRTSLTVHSDVGSRMDGGSPPFDSGVRDAAVPSIDGGTPEPFDAAPMRRDGGPILPTDSGPIGMRDAGTSARDAGTPARDAGTPVRDAGTSARDAGTSARDAGTPARDAGPRPTRELGVAMCTNRIDDDLDGRADCADPDCSPSGAAGECCNGVDDNGDGHIDESTCRCFDDSTCVGVGDFEQVCWTESFYLCAPRCDFYGGDAFCRRYTTGLPRCDSSSGQCVRRR